jgi:4-amino-4-deoxy-L-arabinose transferase-like glycosyltransferase
MRRPRVALSRARLSAATPGTRDPAAPPPAVESGSSAPARGRRFARPGRPSTASLRRPGRSALLVGLALAAIVVVGFVLRVVHIGYGLPYVYNYDEANHFTNHSVNFFTDDFNPGYYQNPSALTYLIYIVLRVQYGLLGGIFHLHAGSITKQFAFDPSPIFQSARVLCAVLAMIGVVATFFVARRFWGARVGLIAAALLTFAFLPFTYSRIAVTDVGTFLPIALALFGVLMVYETGNRRWYVLAGAATGLAIGFKYTAGLVLIPLFLEAARRYWLDRETGWLRRDALWNFVIACAAMTAVFFVTTPFFFVHPHIALYQLKQQAVAAGDTVKVGQEQQGGFVYYFESLGRGFGWAPLVAVAVGAAFELRRNWWRGLLIVVFPVAMFLYLGTQTRYFGRWLLAIYPILAILAAIGVVGVAQLLVRRPRPLASGVLAAALCAGLLVQPVAADIRTNQVLGRTDTRDIARSWLVDRLPRSLRIVVEPAVPDNWYKVKGETTGARQFVRGYVQDIRRQANADAPPGVNLAYAQTLNPGLIDLYKQKGFCYVMTFSLIRGRAENSKLPKALAYYNRLERDARRVLYLSPYDAGRKPVPLHFDFSYNYYPTAFARPGPEVKLYRLDNCREQFGKVPEQPLGTTGLDKGVGTSYVPGSQ